MARSGMPRPTRSVPRSRSFRPGRHRVAARSCHMLPSQETTQISGLGGSPGWMLRTWPRHTSGRVGELRQDLRSSRRTGGCEGGLPAVGGRGGRWFGSRGRGGWSGQHHRSDRAGACTPGCLSSGGAATQPVESRLAEYMSAGVPFALSRTPSRCTWDRVGAYRCHHRA